MLIDFNALIVRIIIIIKLASLSLITLADGRTQ